MKIIIFDDELGSEMQMYLALSHRHEVEIAQDPHDLLTLLEENAADLTFIDLGLCKGEVHTMNAFELTEQIKKKHPKIKVVGIIDQENDQLKEEAANLGIPAVITRPIRNRELLRVVENSD